MGVQNRLHLFDLSGKVACVTGVSKGLGRGMAIALAEAGADIVGIGISDMDDTKSEILQTNSAFHAVQADLSDPACADQAFAEAVEHFGRVDILVNNSGVIHRAAATEYTDKDWERVLNVNLQSVFRLSRAAAKHMIQKQSGKIINIASMLSFQGGSNVVAYTASKHAVAGLTKSFANEVSKHGISVNAIAPGYMATDNTGPLRADEQRANAILARIPQGRWGTPDDLKGAVVFLASAASDYVNGHVLCVDGGWMSS
ncbi:2-dehydro-3-deoxy-D-gluconate 5-dehydrogenase KduD [Alicyclobacillus fodiniaquatilis]|uniref:2-dehydro-3-deoxy-D-gluconate 5-dehydrogenase KduD n=1 Tax=Alicyclobacillus fodiniaquatilis TaxID=1661150 RepID=A0ABW4JFJ8_9BACL